jgi:glutamyl-tRNA synthetase
LELYREASNRLIEQGDAYYCYCSPERLEQMRAEQVRRKQPPGYDRRCRELTDEERASRKAEGITPVVRLKTPLTGETGFDDIIWGRVAFDNSTLDDLVLLKSDGYPTYHLANVVDDHMMKVTHIMRAEEWLSSTPRHVLLYKALGYEPPQFAHLPMLLGSDRSKLSKRHGAVSITEYQEQGYLPEALINFLALLGWSLDDKTEIISRQDLIKHFSLERVSKTAAVFNHEKLNWMNGVYIRSLSLEDFTQKALPILEGKLPPEVKRPLSIDYIRQITPLIQDRAKTLADVPDLTGFFFVEQPEYEASLLIGKNMDKESTLRALEISYERLAQLKEFSNDSLESLLRPLAEELSMKTGQLFSVLRVATTGQTAAPPLFQTMEVLGKECCLKRIETALKRLNQVS